MKNFIIYIIFLLIPFLTESQVSQNMQIFANLNLHSDTTHGYSIGICGYTAPDGKEYAILACYLGTSFVDVTQLSNIHEVAFFPQIFSEWRDMKVYSHFVYITGDMPGCKLQILDLQYLPDSIHYISTFSFPGFSRGHTLEQSGSFLYINMGDYLNGGMFVLDISNPINPVKRGQWELLHVHDCRVVGNRVWACNGVDGYVTLLDISNKDSITLITSWVNGQYPVPHNCALTSDGKYLYTTDETFDHPGKLKIWDVQELNNILLVNVWHPPDDDSATIHNVEFYGHYAVIAYYTAGVRVLDITNEENPLEVAYYDTYPENNNTLWYGCKGVCMLPSGKILANDKETGLYVLRTTFPMGFNNIPNQVPNNFSLQQNYPNPFNPVTMINYQLPTNTFVKLVVYDEIGRLVSILVNEMQDAGTYKLEFNGIENASGIYFYRLSTSQFTQTKKMILLK